MDTQKELIQNLAKKYRRSRLKNWLNNGKTPSLKEQFASEQAIYLRTIKRKEEVMVEVKKRIENEIKLLQTQPGTKAKEDAQKLTTALTKELISKIKEIEELKKDLNLEHEAFNYALFNSKHQQIGTFFIEFSFFGLLLLALFYLAT